MAEGGRITHDESDRVLACPACDHAGDIYHRVGSNRKGTAPYRCMKCHTNFDEPVDRESRADPPLGEPSGRHADGLPSGLDGDMKERIRELRGD